ncbi:MAG: lipoprotein signal peptidase, partial [Paraglaciecola sp.]
PLCLSFSLLKNTKNSSVTKAMQRFFEFFRRKNYGALWSNLLNHFYLSKKKAVDFYVKSTAFLIKGYFFSSP